MLKKRWLFEMERPNTHQTWREFFLALRRDMRDCGRYFALTTVDITGDLRGLMRISPALVVCEFSSGGDSRYRVRLSLRGNTPWVVYPAQRIIDSKFPHREVDW